MSSSSHHLARYFQNFQRRPDSLLAPQGGLNYVKGYKENLKRNSFMFAVIKTQYTTARLEGMHGKGVIIGKIK